ncbi:flagellar export chaperone FliS [Bacillus tianshenii]|nr:flagellar export chaperone FliS [Bacillus tianshenii]
MSNTQAYQKYKSNSVNTASPGELTLMLYNGCIKFIKQAKIAMEKQDIQGRNTNLLKAQDIINELMVTLDTKQEVAQNMLQMYDYIYRRLVEANTKNSLEILEEAEGYVTEFRDTWKQIILELRKQEFKKTGQA